MKAISLFSGGLDSTLASKIIINQGIEVIGVYFDNGFGTLDFNPLIDFAKSFGMYLKIMDIRAEFLSVLSKPGHGYGRAVNPCIDCHAFMLGKARNELSKYGAEFVITGEVLGQRPMSQHLPSLNIVAKESGLGDRLLRPLSAKNLAETMPERMKWVDRQKLYNFSGRSRLPQIKLARELGIADFKQPAGGCLLTDENIGRRIKDIMAYRALSVDDGMLARIGRHFRTDKKMKIIIGRNKPENEILSKYKPGRVYLELVSHPGPSALVENLSLQGDIAIAAGLVARFGDCPPENDAIVLIERLGERTEIKVRPFSDLQQIIQWRV